MAVCSQEEKDTFKQYDCDNLEDNCKNRQAVGQLFDGIRYPVSHSPQTYRYCPHTPPTNAPQTPHHKHTHTRQSAHTYTHTRTPSHSHTYTPACMTRPNRTIQRRAHTAHHKQPACNLPSPSLIADCYSQLKHTLSSDRKKHARLMRTVGTVPS